MHCVRRRDPDFSKLARDIKRWGLALGFQQLGISDTDLETAEARLQDWLARDYHGHMDYMRRHGTRRSRPAELVAGTLRVISVRLDYWPQHLDSAAATLADPARGYVSRYAVGRDYHKVLRKRLQKLADRIADEVGEFGYRAFTDSAPVMEKPLAEKAGLGWIGKHTNLINARGGSWFFLGELYTDLPLPIDGPVGNHCGSCSACIDACPTGAIVAPYQLDARRCISYLTIELRGSIPVALRPLIGNRIFGCDDCQLVCPWNRFAAPTREPDFMPRSEYCDRDLLQLFAWTETDFFTRTAGTAIRRIGYESWLRNIAVALGNAAPAGDIVKALETRRGHPSTIVREHVGWALHRQIAARARHDPAIPSR
jgi:epoxyqueuosine reductase